MGDESILPFLSEFDPPLRAEGSLDPLGLYSVADALGVRLAPGVRERQWKPRFLTLALVGMAACDDELVTFGERKGLPAWLVYEWLIVTSLVREWAGKPELQGIPGRDKVHATLLENDVVCQRTYLKTPSVFGFHGVYRVLGLKAGLFNADGCPLEPGFRVLQAWQRDQGQSGFISGEGPGREFRHLIAAEVRRGIETGYLREAGPKLRGLIAAHLSPHSAGPTEATTLWQVILENDPLRSEYAKRLISPEGQAAWHAAEGFERSFHDWLRATASPPMLQLVEAIQAFETLARSLTDAFEESLWRMTEARGPMTVGELAAGDAIKEASRDGASLLSAALVELGEIDPGLRMRTERALSWIGESVVPTTFMANLLQHHVRIQKAKPPGGKRPWFDTFGDSRYAVRAGYVRDSFEPKLGVYVHQYRARPLWSFARELGYVKSEDQAT